MHMIHMFVIQNPMPVRDIKKLLTNNSIILVDCFQKLPNDQRNRLNTLHFFLCIEILSTQVFKFIFDVILLYLQVYQIQLDRTASFGGKQGLGVGGEGEY